MTSALVKNWSEEDVWLSSSEIHNFSRERSGYLVSSTNQNPNRLDAIIGKYERDVFQPISGRNIVSVDNDNANVPHGHKLKFERISTIIAIFVTVSAACKFVVDGQYMGALAALAVAILLKTVEKNLLRE